MKIKALQVSTFGCLQDRTWSDLVSPFIVVYGPNEAGKSTFFHLMETLFYGWQPVKDNPFLPWGGGEAAFSAELVRENGEVLTVQRSLGRRPLGQIIKKQTVADLGNRKLPFLDFLSRAIFREIYCLTVEQMRFPDWTAWSELEEQLLGGQYLSFLKPVSAVWAELENEANSLWRPDRRGKPRAKQLQAEIAELMKRRQKALENEANLREKAEQIAHLAEKLAQNQKQEIQLSAELERARRLLPLHKKLERLALCESKVGDWEKIKRLPQNLAEQLDHLEVALKKGKAKRARLREKEKQLQEELLLFGEKEQLYLALAVEIKEVAQACSLLINDQQTIKDLEDELRLNEELLLEEANLFLFGTWTAEIEQTLAEIDELELKSCLIASQKAQECYQAKKQAWQSLKEKKGVANLSLWGGTALLLGGAGLSGVFYWGNSPLGLAAALLLILGLGLGLLTVFLREPREKKLAKEKMAQEVQVLKQKKEMSQRAIKEILPGWPLSEQQLAAPGETLWLGLKNLKIYLARKRELNEKLAEVKARLSSSEKKYQSLGQKLNYALTGEILVDLSCWEKQLRLALAKEGEARQATLFLSELKEQLIVEEEELNKLLEEQAWLEKELIDVPGITPEEKIANFLKWREKAQEVQVLRQDLAREYPDWRLWQKEKEAAEARGETCLFNEADLAAKKSVCRQKKEENVALKEEQARLQTELQHLVKNERVADLVGAIEERQKARQEIGRQRDRLVLLQNLLKEAERTFREKHQPDLLEKAGLYLDKITQGRYQRLFVKEDGSGLSVVTHEGRLCKVGFPLSRGTLQQIYLALRFALATHLDQDQEIMPLFLDEVLVNWDDLRLQQGLEILQDLARKRQVFVFTCQAELLHKMEKAGKIQVVELK